MKNVLRVVVISDTHNRHEALVMPPGDLLLHCGDLTLSGTEAEIVAVDRWFAALPHKKIVVIAGNHDFLFQQDRQKAQALLWTFALSRDAG
jgi:predicted phosphodiesterase